MDFGPDRNARHEAPAAGRFGETCALARKHGMMPDPNVFAARFVVSERFAWSTAHHDGKFPDPFGLVA